MYDMYTFMLQWFTVDVVEQDYIYMYIKIPDLYRSN